MATDDDNRGETPSPPRTRKSKSPTWVGTVMSAKDEQIAAIKELSDEKTAFMLDRLNAEFTEREKRSKALYELSEARASDMQKSSENKDITIKRLWIANVIQILIIAALAGVTVTGKIPGVGDIGLDAEKTTAPKTKGD